MYMVLIKREGIIEKRKKTTFCLLITVRTRSTICKKLGLLPLAPSYYAKSLHFLFSM